MVLTLSIICRSYGAYSVFLRSVLQTGRSAGANKTMSWRVLGPPISNTTYFHDASISFANPFSYVLPSIQHYHKSQSRLHISIGFCSMYFLPAFSCLRTIAPKIRD